MSLDELGPYDSRPREKVTSGMPGLDEALSGGFLRGQTTVVPGGPDTGKTMFALQFLAAGGDGLSVGFEEREHELRRNAAALGIDLSDVSVLVLRAGGDRFFDDDPRKACPPVRPAASLIRVGPYHTQ